MSLLSSGYTRARVKLAQLGRSVDIAAAADGVASNSEAGEQALLRSRDLCQCGPKRKQGGVVPD